MKLSVSKHSEKKFVRFKNKTLYYKKIDDDKYAFYKKDSLDPYAIIHNKKIIGYSGHNTVGKLSVDWIDDYTKEEEMGIIENKDIDLLISKLS